MKFLYVIRYQMQGGKNCCTAVYAKGWPEAESKFHGRMANWGCEVDQYSVQSYRCVQEYRLKLPAHLYHIARLTEEDRRQLFTDRRTRQLRNKGRVDQYVARYFQNPMELVK